MSKRWEYPHPWGPITCAKNYVPDQHANIIKKTSMCVVFFLRDMLASSSNKISQDFKQACVTSICN